MSKKTKPLAENYLFIYEGGIQTVSVAVHINYAEGHISLTDNNAKNPTAVQPKQWKFGKRELEYMQGWQDILTAMGFAIRDAKEKLEAYNKAVEEEKRVALEEQVASEMQQS